MCTGAGARERQPDGEAGVDAAGGDEARGRGAVHGQAAPARRRAGQLHPQHAVDPGARRER